MKGRSDLKISYNHQSETDSIPLPATLIHDFSQQFAKNGNQTQLKLYSEFPFPIRKNRKLDEFAIDAPRHLKANPTEAFIRSEVYNGKESLRYAIADVLVSQACVDCHNSRADTPKSNWQLNDVRGVLEVVSPIDKQLATGRSLASWTIGILFVIFVSASLGIYYWIRRSVGDTLDTINDVGDQLTETSKSVLASSRQLANSASEQAASVEETSASLEEISSMTQNNVEHAQRAKEFAAQTRKSVDLGTAETHEMAEAMNEIKDAGDNISKIIKQSTKSPSKRISSL